MKIYEGYLTEEKLGDFLQLVFPEGEWIYNKVIPGSGSKLRPDYRNDYYMLVVEYDGPGHYTNVNTTHRDLEIYDVCCKNGYTFISIPYFLQIDDCLFSAVFKPAGAICPDGVEMSNYPQGFILDTCVFPASYCQNGLLRFSLEMDREFWPYKDDIMATLDRHAERIGETRVHSLIRYEKFLELR